MSTISIRVLHPTSSTAVDGEADTALSLRDVCVDLQRGKFLEPEHQLEQLGATLERTNATLPMTVPIDQLDIQNGDAIALHKQTHGA